MYEVAQEEKPWRPFLLFMITSLDSVLLGFDITDITALDRTYLNMKADAAILFKQHMSKERTQGEDLPRRMSLWGNSIRGPR